MNALRVFGFQLALFAGLLGASITFTSVGFAANAAKPNATAQPYQDSNVLDELDPFAPDIKDQLEKLDREYYRATKTAPWIENATPLTSALATGCYRGSCAVYVHVRKSDQRLDLFVDGNRQAEWAVSTGAVGHETPNFDRHPNGRIYDQYTSTTFPGGNFQGLGNMPYAVFIEGGFAIHGTSKGNWKFLGRRASHGCVRVHPDNGLIFNRLVRKYGVSNVWIQID